MSAFSVVTILNNKKTLFTSIAVFFVPLILFCFWNVPSADDYLILDKKRAFDFWQLQTWVYHTWSGRYVSTFISTCFSYTGFLYAHYYVHTILLFLFTLLAWLFLLKQVNKYLSAGSLQSSSLVLASALLLIVEINIVPEPVTAFYWFSSAITYQVPLILILLLCGVCIKLFNDTKGSKVNGMLACLLVVLINGCNEGITLFVLIAFTLLLWAYYLHHKKFTTVIIALYLVAVISSCFLLFAPGILHRSALHDPSSITSVIAIAFVKFMVLQWFFLKEPIWWFLLVFLVSFLHRHPTLFAQFSKLCNHRFSYLLPVVYIATGMLVYIPILYVANGSLPLRTENILCFLYGLVSMMVVSIFMAYNSTVATTAVFFKYRYLLVSIIIFSSANMRLVSDSLLSGSFYNRVMQQRTKMLEEAKRTQQLEVTFDDYEIAVVKLLRQNPLLNRKMLRDIIVKPPPIFSFRIDFYELGYVKDIYGIREVKIDKR